jgi:hypothetical protein
MARCLGSQGTWADGIKGFNGMRSVAQRARDQVGQRPGKLGRGLGRTLGRWTGSREGPNHLGKGVLGSIGQCDRMRSRILGLSSRSGPKLVSDGVDSTCRHVGEISPKYDARGSAHKG